LIADVLGARVLRNRQKEIGWFPIQLTEAAKTVPLFASWRKTFNAFHWHGDTFQLPSGAVHIASSKGCENQAYVYGERVIGLQFHLESTHTSVADLLENCRDEVVEDTYIQKPEEILGTAPNYRTINTAMVNMLDQLATNFRPRVAVDLSI